MVLCVKSEINPTASKKSRPIKHPKVPTGTSDIQLHMNERRTPTLNRWDNSAASKNEKFHILLHTKLWGLLQNFQIRYIEGPICAESSAPTNSLSGGKPGLNTKHFASALAQGSKRLAPTRRMRTSCSIGISSTCNTSCMANHPPVSVTEAECSASAIRTL